MARASSSSVLVAGIPRSGTTWIARVLAEAGGADYVEEPDNHFRRAYALRVKARLGGGEYPHVSSGEPAPELERLWRAAFGEDVAGASGPGAATRRQLAARLLAGAAPHEVSHVIAGGRGTTRLRLATMLAVPQPAPRVAPVRLVKTVHAPLALEWILERIDAVPLLVFREPLNALSSWLEMGWLRQERKDVLDELSPDVRAAVTARTGVPQPAAAASALARAAWVVGALTAVVTEVAERHPDWAAVSHEALCTDPHESFPRLSRRLGLAWSESGDALLRDANRPGAGYEIARVSEQVPDVWRERLSADEVDEARSVLEPFALDGRIASLVASADPAGP